MAPGGNVANIVMGNSVYQTLTQSSNIGFRVDDWVRGGNGAMRLLTVRVAVILAVIVFGTSGIAAVMTWMPTSSHLTGVDSARNKPQTLSARPVAGHPAPAVSNVRIRVKCTECGVVESTREIKQVGAAGGVAMAGQIEIAAKPTNRYEVNVRMNDGSSRVFMAANPANWRDGKRVILIEGASRSND